MAPDEPQPDQQLKHYRLIEKAGHGGMGVVWKALDTRLDRVVALKLIHPDLVSSPDYHRRFLTEARAVSAVTHPNVCTIHAIEEDDQGRLFLVLEFLEGTSLKQRAADLRGNVSTLLDLLIQGAEGLAEAHRCGIVHRDVKSANLWVTPRGQVKIVDFGLATLRRRGTAPISETSPTEAVTLAGDTVGTVQYMAPEQALGREVDPRSDIFSMGVVLYESLTGRLPFIGRTTVEIFDQILHAEPAPPSTLAADLPFELDRIVMKTLRKDPDERYQTAADLAVDLKALRRELDSGTRSAPGLAARESSARITAVRESGGTWAAVSPRGPSALRSALLVAGAVITLVAVTVGAVVLTNRKPAATADAAVRPALAVFLFENRTGEDRYNWYGTTTADLLNVSLAHLPNVDVLSKQRIYDALRAVTVKGQQPTLDARVATEVARKSGARYVVRGNVLRVSGALLVTAEVVDVESGRVLGAERVTGVTEQNMLDKVDELGRLLAERLKGVS